MWPEISRASSGTAITMEQEHFKSSICYPVKSIGLNPQLPCNSAVCNLMQEGASNYPDKLKSTFQTLCFLGKQSFVYLKRDVENGFVNKSIDVKILRNSKLKFVNILKRKGLLKIL